MAQQLRAAAVIDPSDPRTEVLDLEVAHPAVRTGDPLRELSDRLQRIQTAAWTHTQHASMTVPTLTDLAAVGVMIHAATHRVLLTDPSADPATVNLIAAHGTAWRATHTALSELRSLDPVPGGIRGDQFAIRQLLADLGKDSRAQRVAVVLVDACRSHDRVAEWSAVALTDISAHARVYARARRLTGEDIGDEFRLATAKLTDTLNPAPQRIIDKIKVTLVAVAQTTVGDHDRASESRRPPLDKEPVSAVSQSR